MSYKPVYRKINPDRNDGKKYRLSVPYSYYSERYGKWVHLEAGFKSDGATCAKDLKESWSWWVHDKLCESSVWGDGSPCSAEEASMVLSDILDAEGRKIRKYTWKYCTFLFGSWKLKRRVGWFKRKK